MNNRIQGRMVEERNTRVESFGGQAKEAEVGSGKRLNVLLFLYNVQRGKESGWKRK